MSVKPQRAPQGLAGQGLGLWRSIRRQIAGDGPQFDAPESQLLKATCRGADMLAKIEADLVDAPMTARDAQGQLVAHPLLGEARRSRTTIAGLLKSLGLEDPLTVRPGSGSRTTSWQDREAAQTRHRGA